MSLADLMSVKNPRLSRIMTEVPPKLLIALTDDWELRGNGLGTVDRLQVRPALRLMDLYARYGVKSTFNAEVLQQLAFEAHAARYPKIARQRDLWIQTVQKMLHRGFDVQLHLHPQWFGAEFDGSWWKLGRKWNIVAYSPAEIEDMVQRSIRYLSAITAPRQIVSFRAGAWGMGPPSRVILECLIRHGIKIDMSVVQGNYYNTEHIKLDYRKLESPYLAYRPNLDDIRVVDSDGQLEIVEVPTQSVGRSVASRLVLKALKLMGGSITSERSEMVQGVASPPAHVVRNPFGARAESSHILDLSSEYSAAGFQLLVGECIRRALSNRTRSTVALVFENHTKDLQTDSQFRAIETVIRHIQRRYPEAEFVTLTDLARGVQSLV